MRSVSGTQFILCMCILLSVAACSSAPVVTPSSVPVTPSVTATTLLAPSATIAPTRTNLPLPTFTVTPSPTPLPDYFNQIYPLSSNAYVIPLSIRHITEQTATFFFELQNPQDGIFVYRSLRTQAQQEIPLAKGETRHMLTVDGLNPNDNYAALVLLGSAQTGFEQIAFNQSVWGAVEFKCLPEQYPITVGVLGDASFGDAATQALIAQMATHPLDFVIHTGDVVYQTDTTDIFKVYAATFFEPFSPLLHRMPVYTVLGNHDYDAAVRFNGAPFYDYVFPPFPSTDFTYPQTRRDNQYYAFSINDIQFIFLDTHVFAGAAGRAEQDRWLETRLSDPTFRASIVVFHVAPFSSSIVHPDDGRPVRLSWNRRFENANVPLVLSGHFHHYERLISNGVTYIVTGGGSSTLYAQGEKLPESWVYARKTHFVLLQIYAERITLRAISAEGEILDDSEIILDVP